MEKRKSVALAATLLSALAGPLAAAPPSELVLAPSDLRIEQRTDGGYHLYVRAKKGLLSVLLTESTKDPALKADNYAYRAKEWNPINGDEQRLLDGKPIPASSKIYSLIDSSPEPDALLGSAYHIFIPWVVAWGYSWSRQGETFISDGTFINVRTFSKPYADYTGSFADNPYVIRVTQKPGPKKITPPPPPPPEPKPEPKPEPAPVVAPIPEPEPEPQPEPIPEPEPEPKPEPEPPPAPKAPEPEPPEPEPPAPPPPPPAKPDLSLYMPETVTTFESIAEKGEARYAKDEDDITPQIDELLDRAEGKSLDIVVCLDTTDSMGDDIDSIKASLPGLLKKRIADFSGFRIGFVLYKDYFEEYLYKRFDFAKDLGAFQSNLSAVRVGGGRDIPEAVYEALYASLVEFPWSAEKRMIILIGDAPPHPLPRGNVNKAKVNAKAAELGVELDVIILPH